MSKICHVLLHIDWASFKSHCPTHAVTAVFINILLGLLFANSYSVPPPSEVQVPLNGSASVRRCHTPAYPWFCAWRSQWLWWRGMVNECSLVEPLRRSQRTLCTHLQSWHSSWSWCTVRALKMLMNRSGIRDVNKDLTFKAKARTEDWTSQWCQGHIKESHNLRPLRLKARRYIIQWLHIHIL